jgi:ankyrin repeat protein
LHKAANNGHIEIVKLLLAKGANRFAKYQDGKTALDLAIKAEHMDIVELLNKTPLGSANKESENLPDDDLKII